MRKHASTVGATRLVLLMPALGLAAAMLAAMASPAAAAPEADATLRSSDASLRSTSWPQLQHDSARTGYTPEAVPPPFRPRWIWFGDTVLRNKLSKSGDAKWNNDLKTGRDTNFPMPERVEYSFAGSMQPVVAGGKVFVADVQGKVYAISLDDGATLWTAPNPGGSLWTGVVAGDVVAFPSLQGCLTGYSVSDGKQLWQVDTGRTITTAPALADGVVYVASQSGRVCAVQPADGKVLWTSDYLGAPIQGGLCVANGKVYLGTEGLEALALSAKDGKVVARRKLPGQSFRHTWPVAVKDRVVFTTVPVICAGSEYINDGVLFGRPGTQGTWVANAKPGYADAAAEDEAKRKWLADSSRLGGKWWELCFSLKADTLEQDYVIATGATEGCGSSPEPPVIDGQGRPIVWWATAFPTFTKKDSFGTSFSMDLSPFDLSNGKRVLIDNKDAEGKTRLSGQTTETDNLYGMTVGGDIIYLRQGFRGTWCANLKTSQGTFISAVYYNNDGADWPATFTYSPGRGQAPPPRTPPSAAGRVAPVIAGGRLLYTEGFCLTCVESAQPAN